MEANIPTPRELSARRIIGFACNQAFVFALLFMGASHGAQIGGYTFKRIDFVVTLLLMVVGFALVRLLIRVIDTTRLRVLFSRPLLYVYAVVAAGGELVPFLAPVGLPAFVAQGALVGFPCALLLTAWGRVFGGEQARVSVPEVFLGSLVGALVCLVFSLIGDSPFLAAALAFLPLGSVVNIEISPGEVEQVTPPENDDAQARAISAKILAGTFLFGAAAGIMQMHAVGTDRAVPYYPVSLVLFGAFLIGGLTLLLSDGFGRGAALNKSYRLAVFMMMVGVLLVPWAPLAASALPGESVVLAGYLGLEAVLISLFLVVAKITGTDCELAFSAGFLSLFAGEFAGALLPEALPGVVIAGVLVLLSYIFLFTERDFDTLSEIVTETDAFEDTCATIAERYGLSKRESEILAYALRGRTSERIAQELVIAKSTVDTHLRRIYAKCGVHSRQELLDLAGL